MGNFTNSDYVLVDNMAAELIALNGDTTNLDIKKALRKAFPGSWVQQTISDVMMELSDVEGKYVYVLDHATDELGILREFRRYSLPVPVLADGDDEDDDVIPTASAPAPAPVVATAPVVPPPVIKTDVTDVAAHNANPTNAEFEVPANNILTPAPAPVDEVIPTVTSTPTPRGNILNRLRRAMGGK